MEDKEAIEFIRGKRLVNYLEDYIGTFEPPFFDKLVVAFLKKLSTRVASAVENLVGEKIYIKKPASQMERIPPRFYKLIERLASADILKNISFPSPLPDWPKIPAVSLKSSRGFTAAGYALDYDTAAKKAFAEFLEWQAFSEYDGRKSIVGSWSELRKMGAVDPRRFAAFSQRQLGEKNGVCREIDENSKFRWVECFSFLERKKFLVPAQLVYFGYDFLPEEPLIRKSTSNGGAAGTSEDMALARGLFEVIERDALMIHWLNKITPPRFDIDSITEFGNEKITKIIGEFRKYGVDFAILDITTDLGVPVILTVIRDDTPGRQVIFMGAGADLDIEAAIFHSLLEGLRAGYWSLVAEEKIVEADKKAPLVENIKERKAFWCDRSRLSEADFLFEGPLKRAAKNEYSGAGYNVKLRRLKEIFKARGMDVYAVDCTTAIANEFGLKIMMVLAPELCYLYLDERFKYLGAKRLYEAPVKMGIFNESKKEEEMNAVPHPFL